MRGHDVGITAVILTYNEEETIGELLAHLSWCDEVIIVDSQSDDETRTIARTHDTEVVDVPAPEPGEPFDHFRQVGVDAADNEWIITIDADERIPLTLREALERHVRQDRDERIVEAPRANYFRGRQLLHTNLWPAYSVVLFNKGAVEFTEVPHAFVQYHSDQRRRLPAREEYAVHHYFTDSVVAYWRTQRRYAKIGGNYRPFKFRHLLSPIYGFYERFIRHEGYKDGLAGLGFSLAWAWYQAETTARSAINRDDW